MLTQEVKDILVAKMYPPTGIWADFTYDVRMYDCLLALVRTGQMTDTDLPPEPIPSYYPDLTSPKTRP